MNLPNNIEDAAKEAKTAKKELLELIKSSCEARTKHMHILADTCDCMSEIEKLSLVKCAQRAKETKAFFRKIKSLV